MYDQFDYDGSRDVITATPRVDAAVSGSETVALSLFAYHTAITTGGTDGNENVTIPNGVIAGQRKLVSLGTRTGTDTVVIAVTNIDRGLHAGETPATITALNLDAAGEYALLEWSGLKWNILYSNGTITTPG